MAARQIARHFRFTETIDHILFDQGMHCGRVYAILYGSNWMHNVLLLLGNISPSRLTPRASDEALSIYCLLPMPVSR